MKILNLLVPFIDTFFTGLDLANEFRFLFFALLFRFLFIHDDEFVTAVSTMLLILAKIGLQW